MQIILADDFETYMRTVERTHGPTIRRLREKTRKLERDYGELRFERHSDDPEALATLLGWKADQYEKTGASNILEQAWIPDVLRRAHAAQTEDFSGLLSFLYADVRPVAGHLGIRSAGVCHSWFPAYDPEFSTYSPGLILLLKLTETAPDANIGVIDLGRGDYRYKRMLMNGTVRLAEGAVQRPSLAAGASRSRRAVKSLIRRTTLAPKIRRVARRVAGGR
jgi:CelD/BcsL family acetyltransferase involved in cellulose biosynthesis